MPRGGFETATTVFERAKAIHALDLPATVVDCYTSQLYKRNGSPVVSNLSVLNACYFLALLEFKE
jgi:hypothetical protein